MVWRLQNGPDGLITAESLADEIILKGLSMNLLF